MILAIDIGNSFIKWKVWDHEGNVVDRRRLKHDQCVAEYFPNVFSTSIDCVAVSNVANSAIEDELRNLFQATEFVSFKSTQSCLGLVSGYQQPERLGVDRWLAIIEAYHQAGKRAVCVFDLGTAATLDVVDEAGQHLGGYIVPGISLMREVLQQSTSRVRVDERGGSVAYGTNTSQAVENGMLAMMAAWIKQEIDTFKKQHPRGEVYLSGGDAGMLAGYLNVNTINIYEDLVLDGLRRIATR